MKQTLIVISFLLFIHSCNNSENLESKISKKYPFFENINLHAEVGGKSNKITLDNFKSKSQKKGLEYLVDINGNLIESRFYENNLLNGPVIHYSTNKKPTIIAYYKNDTLSGDFFEIDSLTNNIDFWTEKKLKNGIVYDKQYVKFFNGNIDLIRSSFYLIEKMNDTTVFLSIPCKYPFPYTKVTFLESSNISYEDIDKGNEMKSKDGVHYYYRIKDKESKYILGKILYYKLSNGEGDEGITGQIIYCQVKNI